MRRLIVRWRKRNGQECFAALLSTLTPRQVFGLLGESPQRLTERRAVALAYAYLYDRRGGAIEIEIKEDKQGFGLARDGSIIFGIQFSYSKIRAHMARGGTE